MDYPQIATDALEAIKDAGRAVQFYTPASGDVYDPVTGTWSAGSAASTIDGYGVKLNYKSYEFNELVQSGDVKLLYSGEAPAIGQQIDLDSETWRVMNTNPLAPDGTILLYKVQLRR